MVARYLSVNMDGVEADLATPGQTSNDLEATEWRLQDQLECWSLGSMNTSRRSEAPRLVSNLTKASLGNTVDRWHT